MERVEAPFCGTALAEFGGYNRTWKCRAPAVTMYDRGSLFHLVCSETPAPERLRAIEREGLGIRRGEGFGQVLFLSPERFENLRNKASVERPVQGRENRSVRDGEYRWVMDHADKVRQCGLSRSQIGTLQALCQQALSHGGDAGRCTPIWTRICMTGGCATAENLRRWPPWSTRCWTAPWPRLWAWRTARTGGWSFWTCCLTIAGNGTAERRDNMAATYTYAVRYEVEARCSTPLRTGGSDGDTEQILRSWTGPPCSRAAPSPGPCGSI